MKYAVVTGSTQGIGRAIAEKLLDEGWFVFANYAHDDECAAEFERDQKMRRGMVCLEVIKENLSSIEAVQRFAARICEKGVKIDCLVLNAGTTDRSPFEEITPESWMRVMNTNLNAPFYLVHALRDVLAENTGRIIFIGSVLGVLPHSVSPAYGVSKAAVHQLAKELVKVFAPKGITVNAIVSGFVDTPWQQRSGKSPERRKRIEEKVASGRFAQAEEIASLCWEVVNNPYINGANLRIDGGYCYR